MTGDGPVCLRGAVEMLLWLCSTIRATIRTMRSTVRCNGNLQFPLHCQVCQVPPDVLNVRVQALLCSRRLNCCIAVFCLEALLLRLLGLFLINSCIFLIPLSLFSKNI